MNITLLITIMFTLASVHGYNQRPCQWNPNNNAYNAFVRRHILQESLNEKTSKDEWRNYLEYFGLCGRTPVQSFIAAPRGQILQICSRAGRRVRGATGRRGNLCISNQPMTIYDVESNNRWGCRVTNVNRVRHRVIVACDTIDNRCLPVHYERYSNQRPDNRRCM